MMSNVIVLCVAFFVLVLIILAGVLSFAGGVGM
jgi:hypothetical protein